MRSAAWKDHTVGDETRGVCENPFHGGDERRVLVALCHCGGGRLCRTCRAACENEPDSELVGAGSAAER